MRVWLAARAGRLCTSAQLTQEQAHWVDEETTPYVETLPPGRYLNLVRAKIIAADPAAAAERAKAAELARFVRAGQTDENGLRTLVARARAGDVTVLVAVIDRIAAILSDRGDTDPVDVRRATALRVLANPAEALELLASAALQHLDDSQPADEADGCDEATGRRGRRAGGAPPARRRGGAVRRPVRRPPRGVDRLDARLLGTTPAAELHAWRPRVRRPGRPRRGSRHACVVSGRAPLRARPDATRADRAIGAVGAIGATGGIKTAGAPGPTRGTWPTTGPT